jgi:hypothetical protein
VLIHQGVVWLKKSRRLIGFPYFIYPITASTVQVARKVSDNFRIVKIGEKIALSKAEQFGSFVTMSIFLSSMLQGVDAYIKKTEAWAAGVEPIPLVRDFTRYCALLRKYGVIHRARQDIFSTHSD